mgnify:CR=1 FL=1
MYFWGTNLEFYNCSINSQVKFYILSLKNPLFSDFVFEPPIRYILSPSTIEVWWATDLGTSSNLIFGSLTLALVLTSYHPNFKSDSNDNPWKELLFWLKTTASIFLLSNFILNFLNFSKSRLHILLNVLSLISCPPYMYSLSLWTNEL